jgi:hypothetical protein
VDEHARLRSAGDRRLRDRGRPGIEHGQTACPSKRNPGFRQSENRRPWFTHQIYAPGFYTGYGVKTLPAVREAIEERDFAEATAQIPKVAAAIEAYAAEIEKAAAALQ